MSEVCIYPIGTLLCPYLLSLEHFNFRAWAIYRYMPHWCVMSQIQRSISQKHYITKYQDITVFPEQNIYLKCSESLVNWFNLGHTASNWLSFSTRMLHINLPQTQYLLPRLIWGQFSQYHLTVEMSTWNIFSNSLGNRGGEEKAKAHLISPTISKNLGNAAQYNRVSRVSRTNLIAFFAIHIQR